ncbi:MAG: hypothetical protein ACM3S4_11520 [Burkholderiales bacterium]
MNLLNFTVADIAQILISILLIIVTIKLEKQANKISEKSNELSELSYVQQKEVQDTQIKLTLFDKRYKVYSFLTKDIFDDSFFNESNIGRNMRLCENLLNSVDFLFNIPESELIKKKLNMILFSLQGVGNPEPLENQELEEKAQDEHIFGGYDIRISRVLIAVYSDCQTIFLPYFKLT